MNPIEDTLPEVPQDQDGPRLAEIVDELGEMNSDDWTTFVDNGVVPGSEVRVEFVFAAPDEEAATELADDLLAEGYEAVAAASGVDADEWGVKGTTPPVTVSAAGLAEWIRRLAAYGLDHDDCVLDGWAAVLE